MEALSSDFRETYRYRRAPIACAIRHASPRTIATESFPKKAWAPLRLPDGGKLVARADLCAHHAAVVLEPLVVLPKVGSGTIRRSCLRLTAD